MQHVEVSWFYVFMTVIKVVANLRLAGQASWRTKCTNND